MSAQNRMSSLALAEKCARSGLLNSASGRPAVLGSAFHAVCGDQPDKKEWLFKLTAEEREEIAEWHKPTDLYIPGWGTFRYAEARKEITVCLNINGNACTEDDPNILTVGHLDSGWVMDGHESEDPEANYGMRLVVVSDIKKSRWTVEGPDTLQLKSYALAAASLEDGTHYVTDIWAATEGVHITGAVTDLMDAGDDWDRVKHAASNRDMDAPVLGSHCRDCWGWQRCDAYTMVASGVDGMADEEEVGEDNAAHLLMQAEAAIRFGDLTKKRLQLYAAKKPIVSEDGMKRWGITMTKGKESVMGVKKLREKLGKEEADKLITRGVEFPQYRWTNTIEGRAAALKRTADKGKATRAAKKVEKDRMAIINAGKESAE